MSEFIPQVGDKGLPTEPGDYGRFYLDSDGVWLERTYAEVNAQYVRENFDASVPSSVVREEEPGLTLDQHIAIIHEVLDLRSDVPWPSIAAVIDAASEVAVVVQSAKAEVIDAFSETLRQGGWSIDVDQIIADARARFGVSVQKQEN